MHDGGGGANISRPVTSWLLGLICLTTIVVYAPGLHGDFMFDDMPNIVNNSAVQIYDLSWAQLRQAWGSGVVGFQGRALSMLSFGINWAIASDNPAAFKFVNLLLHLANGLLVFVMTRQLVRAAGLSPVTPALALWVTAAWLIHPINLTPVLYVVQRMTELAAFFTFAGLIVYFHARRDDMTGVKRFGLLIFAFALWFLGLLAKENAVLAPLFALAAEFFVLRSATDMIRWPRWLIQWIVTTLAFGILYCCIAAWFGWFVFSHEPYKARDFTMFERLLTEGRIVWFYVGQILVPASSKFNLFHDGWIISRGWWAPPTTSLALIAWVGVVWALFGIGRRRPLIGLGVAWFLIGHLLESTFISLELIFEHRNYAPSWGLLLAVADAGCLIFSRLNMPRLHRSSTALSVLALLALLPLATITATRAHAFGSPVRLYALELNNNPDSSRAHINYATALYEESIADLDGQPELRDKIQALLLRGAELDGERAYPWLAKIHLACQFHDPASPAWTKALLAHWQGTRPYGDTMTTMSLFAGAASRGQLCLEPVVIEEHFDAFLVNPLVSAAYRAEITMLYANFVLRVQHDSARALLLASQALSIDASPAFSRKYAGLLRELGKTK